MGFNCILCGEREIWAFESSLYQRICYACHYCVDKETIDMKKHRILNKQTLVDVKKNKKSQINKIVKHFKNKLKK